MQGKKRIEANEVLRQARLKTHCAESAVEVCVSYPNVLHTEQATDKLKKMICMEWSVHSNTNATHIAWEWIALHCIE